MVASTTRVDACGWFLRNPTCCKAWHGTLKRSPLLHFLVTIMTLFSAFERMFPSDHRWLFFFHHVYMSLAISVRVQCGWCETSFSTFICSSSQNWLDDDAQPKSEVTLWPLGGLRVLDALTLYLMFVRRFFWLRQTVFEDPWKCVSHCRLGNYILRE